MRDKKFLIDSIKMDLHRVASAAGDISKPLPKESIEEFLNHAIKDFNKIETTPLEETLKKQLTDLSTKINTLLDPHKRLMWTENIITIRCRVG
jgi:hypothetical protein